MNRALPAVLVTILVTSLLAVPVVSSGPSSPTVQTQQPSPSVQYLAADQETPVEIDGTTNRLPLTGDVTAERVTYGSDLGVALSTTDDDFAVDHAQYALVDRQFATADDEERASMIGAAYNDIRDRSEQLKEREEAAVRAHAEGDLSDRELLQTLLRNHNEASSLQDALDRLTSERTDRVDGYDLSVEETRAEETVLDLHQSPIRSSLLQTAQSGDRQAEVAIATAVDDGEVIGYSLAMIEGDTYVTETVRFDNRRPSSVPDDFEQWSYSQIMEHASDRYPWAGDEQGWSRFSDGAAENLYELTLEVDEARMTIYLDGGSGEVYREQQELPLDDLPTEDVETVSQGGYDVNLTTTPASGPSHIEVTDPDGAPVEATVTADEGTLGETTDGTLWYLPPDDEGISVHVDGQEITVREA